MLNYFFVCLSFFWLFFYTHKIICYLNDKFYLGNSKIIIELYKYFCDSAYEVILKSSLTPYISSGTLPQDETLQTIEKNYVRYLINLMGNRNYKLFVNFFGGEEPFYSNCISSFRDRLDSNQMHELVKKINEREINNAE